MSLTPDFLAVILSSGICPAYYELCKQHPLRAGTPAAQASAKAILKAAAGRVSLTQAAGASSVFELGALPKGVSLNFIVQGRTAVETDFAIRIGVNDVCCTFAVACHDAAKAAGLPTPDPPYPRPEFHSLEELIGIFEQLDGLIRKLAAAIPAAAGVLKP